MQNVSHSCRRTIDCLSCFDGCSNTDCVVRVLISVLADTNPVLILQFRPPVHQAVRKF